MIEQYRDHLHAMADAAGAILRRHFRASIATEQKADLSPVTQADREVEQALRAYIAAHFPDDGIIGEEYGFLRPQAKRQWVLDPIDGTRAFIAGFPLFTTLIGLVIDDRPILGLIDQPITGERWLGETGEVSQLNSSLIHTRACLSLASAVIATTSTYHFSPAQAQLFERLRATCAQTVLGGDAYAYAMLAGGQLDIVIDAELKPYDFCAVVPVIQGAGGMITDWHGKALTLASAGDVIACATPALHLQALELLHG